MYFGRAPSSARVGVLARLEASGVLAPQKRRNQGQNKASDAKCIPCMCRRNAAYAGREFSACRSRAVRAHREGPPCSISSGALAPSLSGRGNRGRRYRSARLAVLLEIGSSITGEGRRRPASSCALRMHIDAPSSGDDVCAHVRLRGEPP